MCNPLIVGFLFCPSLTDYSCHSLQLTHHLHPAEHRLLSHQKGSLPVDSSSPFCSGSSSLVMYSTLKVVPTDTAIMKMKRYVYLCVHFLSPLTIKHKYKHGQKSLERINKTSQMETATHLDYATHNNTKRTVVFLPYCCYSSKALAANVKILENMSILLFHRSILTIIK